jgi:hypothetical protein
MLIFFDTEFTGLYKDAKLISIGLVSQDGKRFYWEMDKNYYKDEVNEWVKKNVIPNLISSNTNADLSISNFGYGDKLSLKVALSNWLYQFDNVQLVSDVCHFDMVLFIDIFGSAFDLPPNISPTCHDINQDIARYLNITEREAFDINREEFAGVEKSKIKHNALWDAEIIKKCYEKIYKKV